jgi:hypothetical protein
VQLEDLTLNLRSRAPWEAIDLGFGLVRRHWKAIYGAWMVSVLPFFLFVYVALQDLMWLAPIVFWWFKPLYDRVVLHVLSRAIFDDPPSLRETLSALPGLLRTGALAQLTLLRIPNFTRSFNLPVWQLEGLRGKARRRRQGVLQMRARSYAVWLTLVCVGFEIIAWLSIYALIWMFLPPHVEFDLPDFMFEEQPEYWVALVQGVFYFLVVTLIEPLYVAGGFTLYLNRRTQLEGWDIEITFRRLARRLAALRENAAPAFAALAFGALLMLGSPQPVLADAAAVEKPLGEEVAETRLPPERSAEIIKQVLASQDFGHTETVMRWRLKERDSDDKNQREDGPEIDPGLESLFENFARVMSTITEAALWFLLGVAILLLIIYRDRWLHLFTRHRRVTGDYTPPESLFGLDLRAESLPADIAAEARRLWGEGRHRAAMSLLYRGALATLVNRERLELHDSHTEGDILELARRALTDERHAYLAELTAIWQLIAYAHREPDLRRSGELLARWNRHFGPREEDAVAREVTP